MAKCVNFVTAGDLNLRILYNLCRDMDLKNEAFIFYSKVPWPSKGNVVNQVFEIYHKLFLDMQGKDDLLSQFSEVVWEPSLVHFADIHE